jgi:hypothetical protein
MRLRTAISNQISDSLHAGKANLDGIDKVRREACQRRILYGCQALPSAMAGLQQVTIRLTNEWSTSRDADHWNSNTEFDQQSNKKVNVGSRYASPIKTMYISSTVLHTRTTIRSRASPQIEQIAKNPYFFRNDIMLA